MTLEYVTAQRLLKLGLEKGFDLVVAEDVEWRALFQVAHEKKTADYNVALDYMYEQGKGVKQDILAAKTCLLLAAEQGHVDAQIKLSKTEKQLHWLTRAAAGGTAKGQIALAQYYMEQKESASAIQFYNLAIEQHNSASAKYALGVLFVNECNYVKAIPLLESCVHEHGMEKAAFTLAECYGKDDSSVRSIEKFLLYLGPGFVQNNPVVLDKITHLFMNGATTQYGTSIAKQHVVGVEFVRKAINAGSARGHTRLGMCYHDGRVVEKDYQKAFEKFQISAEMKDPWGQYYLGTYYRDGIVVQKDPVKAYLLFQQAAAQKDEDALLALSECYRTGNGIEKDLGKAIIHVREAAQLGNREAQRILDNTPVGKY